MAEGVWVHETARAETAISRYKRVIGDELRSHTEERRATEMDVAVYVLNRMLELGRVDGLGRVCGEWIPKFVDL